MKKGLAYKGLNRLAVGDDSHSNVFILDGDNCWRNAIHLDARAANFHVNHSYSCLDYCMPRRVAEHYLFKDKSFSLIRIKPEKSVSFLLLKRNLDRQTYILTDF